MKKIKIVGIFVLIMMLMCFNTISAVAAESPQGTLVSVEYENYPDGTYSVEKTYVQLQDASPSPFAVTKTYGTDTFTKEKEWYGGTAGNQALLVSAYVTASFDWDSSTKKVTVYDAKGEVTYAQTAVSNKKLATSGNNTSKATATYSFTRNAVLGNYSISASCDYKGTDS